MPIFIPKSPRKSSCVLGRSGAAAAQPCFSAWRSGMYSSSYFWCPKIGIQWSDLLRKMIIMRFMLVYIYMCMCIYIYHYHYQYGYSEISASARVYTLRWYGDAWVLPLYLVWAMPSFQNVQHIGKARIIREVISHLLRFEPTRFPSLSNTQIVRVWYVCWGWKGPRSCHLP